MARHAHTFRLDDTDPRERALQRRLEDRARTREKASAIVEALLSHHAGAAGVTSTPSTVISTSVVVLTPTFATFSRPLSVSIVPNGHLLDAARAVVCSRCAGHRTTL
jgi:hypothetical protein